MFTGKFTNLHQGYDELHEFGSLPDNSPKTGREYVDRLTSWIDRHPKTPFFAYLQAFDPHTPYEPRKPYNTLWADPAGREEHVKQIAKLKPFVKRNFMYQQQLANRKEMVAAGIEPEAFFDYHKDWYDGSIRGMDAEIGRLLENLKRNGLLESTLIVFFSDHGEEFHEHDGVFHGQSVYGELTDVPLFFYWPAGLQGGAVVPETVRSIDIMPTVVQLSGLTAPAQMQGQSLLPLMTSSSDQEWQPLPAVSENVTTLLGDVVATAISSGDWRLIHHTVIPNADRPEYELFNRRADPLNLENMAGEKPDVVERMKKELNGWRESAVAARLSAEDSTADMTPQEIERLKSLGYLQ
jgi:arylsulfatase A-like enzyme